MSQTLMVLISDLKQAFNLTEQFLAKMANTSEELRYHTVVEIDNLQKLYDTTKVVNRRGKIMFKI